MSAHHEDAAHAGHHHHDEHDHGSYRSYLTGFALSVLLTAIPFWLVMARPIESAGITGLIVVAFAAVQIVVHMIYFLHMNTRSEGGWTMTAMVFTVILVVIVLAGSLWVMYNLNVNMMPQHDMELMRQQQQIP